MLRNSLRLFKNICQGGGNFSEKSKDITREVKYFSHFYTYLKFVENTNSKLKLQAGIGPRQY